MLGSWNQGLIQCCPELLKSSSISNIQQAGIRKCGCFSWVSLTNKELEEYTLRSNMDTSELVSLWMVWLKEDIEDGSIWMRNGMNKIRMDWQLFHQQYGGHCDNLSIGSKEADSCACFWYTSLTNLKLIRVFLGNSTKRWVLPTMFGSYGETIGLFWLAMPWSGMNLQSMVPWAWHIHRSNMVQYMTDMVKETSHDMCQYVFVISLCTLSVIKEF